MHNEEISADDSVTIRRWLPGDAADLGGMGAVPIPVMVYGVVDEEPNPATMVGEFDQEGLRQALMDMTSIRFGPVDPSRMAFHPIKSHPGDAGYDLTVTETTIIKPGQFKDLPTNVWCAMPPRWWGLIQGRSSSLRKLGLMVNPGIIDNGYRGELFAGAFNLGPTNVVVEIGQRVAQFIPMHQPELIPAWSDQSPPHGERGSRGFGSTGR